MIYLLDANALIAVLNDRDSGVARRLRQQRPEDVGVSAIVAHELFYGAFKSVQQERNLARLDRAAFEIVEFGRDDARMSGAVRALLGAAGAPISPYDVLIAGQAKARGLILVTRNTSEFRRVPDLQVEEWAV